MKKKIVITLIVGLLIVLVIILGLIMLISNNNENNNDINVQKPSTEVKQNSIEIVSNKEKMLAVQNYIQEYLEQINLNNTLYYTRGEKLDQSIISEWIYNLLSKDYIKENSITKDNVCENIETEEEKLLFVAIQMKQLELENGIKYAVYGACQDQDGNFKKDIYVIFNVDNKNSTYSIEPLKGINSIDDIKLTDNELTIEPNQYNIYKEKNENDEYICEQYLLMYKRLMLIKTQTAYDYLNEEYKNQKFESFKEYSEYVSQNRDNLTKTALKTYSVKNNRYMCQDQFDNYYIFNIDSALDYDVMLDVYTVDLDEFIQKYNSSNEQSKVAMNVAKIENALNNKDYKYIYSKLDETFRNNNFGSLENFKVYVSKNFFDNNEIDCQGNSNEGQQVYVYRATLIDSDNSNNRKDITIIMKLLEGTNFTMSFSL